MSHGRRTSKLWTTLRHFKRAALWSMGNAYFTGSSYGMRTTGSAATLTKQCSLLHPEGETRGLHNLDRYCPVQLGEHRENRRLFAGLDGKMRGVDSDGVRHSLGDFQGGAHNDREDTLRPADGVSAVEHLHADRRTLRGRPPSASAVVCRAIPCD